MTSKAGMARGIPLCMAVVFIGLVFGAAGRSSGESLPPIRTYDETPAWSPDGRWIVYSSNRADPTHYVNQLYLIRPDGSHLRRLTWGADAREPSFSPDGTRIVYAVNVLNRSNYFTEHSQIAVTTVTGRDFRVLSGDLHGDLEQPAWSPDGRKVAFLDEVWDGTSADYVDSLYVVNADGSGLRELATKVDGWSFSWSPDGTRIALAGADEHLYLLRADRRRPLDVEHEAFGSATTDIDWSPDGRYVAYVSGSSVLDGSGDIDPRHLYIRDLQTGRVRWVRTAIVDSNSIGSFEQTIEWLPGRSPLLAVFNWCTIQLLDPAGHSVLALEGGDQLSAGSASPDGRRLVVIESPGGYRAALVVEPTTGGARRRITQR
jgi:Tol biopolymer transport system component